MVLLFARTTLYVYCSWIIFVKDSFLKKPKNYKVSLRNSYKTDRIPNKMYAPIKYTKTGDE